MLSSMCQHVARLQFDSCAEKHSLCGTVMIHDGLNLTSLHQCHGVRSHGTSSSQGWHKGTVVQSSLNLIHEFTSLFSQEVIFAVLLRHAFVDTS